jgi:glycosyltransferase involved in cell wall biosynthesis
MTIFLQPEVRSGLGECTFWVWLEQNIAAHSYDAPRLLQPEDRLLRYSTLGPPPASHAEHSIALCFELFPEMRLQLGSNEWDEVIRRTQDCAAGCRRRVISTEFSRPFYEPFGKCDLLPIGIDCELFCQRDPRDARADYDLPADRVIGFWHGTMHRMKGFDLLLKYAGERPEVFWVIVWKTRQDAREARWQFGELPGFRQYTHVPQESLAELMSAADFYLSPSRLRPFYMVEWEAMACNLPIVNASGIEKDFAPSANPRDDVLARGWDRKSALKTWMEYLQG